MAASLERLKVLQQQVAGDTRTAAGIANLKPNLVINGRHFDNQGSYEYIKVSVLGSNKNIGLIELNRPTALNALCDPLMRDLCNALDAFELDNTIACVILTGSRKAFSAGADIKQMSSASSFAEIYKLNFFSHWDRLASFRKPLIAAVNGYAYGGGCEIAMMCDIIYAGDKAKFGQPEVKIGTIPGAGGTQRLPRTVGKSKAMEMILSGDPISAQEAKQCGLVAEVYPADELIDRVLGKAERIAANSHLITSMAKEATGKAFEMSLAEGLKFEKRISNATFATSDRMEGMLAFVEKRKPNYTNE